MALGCYAAVAAAADSGIVAASREDLRRARIQKPGDRYRGDGQEALSRVLNAALAKSEGGLVRECANWTAPELQRFMARILERRHPELNALYHRVADRRRLQRASLEEYQQHWERANGVTDRSPHLHKPLRDSHCRQAVMMWTHHITEETRNALRSEGHEVPMLPEEEKAPCHAAADDEHEQAVCEAVEQENSCDWCHSEQSTRQQPGHSAPNALLPQYVGPDDGNPHGWDRKRRCDQDYKDPPCGMCEGIGGVAWSDKNDDIHLTTCTPLLKPDEVNMSTVARPIYPKAFTSTKYKDVLIGQKTDPFCFKFFPGPDSLGALCYRAEDGIVKYYDIEREAVRTDYNVRMNGVFSLFGNITSSVTHVGKYMWIINKLWAGIEQCICTDPGRNHCTQAPNCSSYVWHYNFAETAQYLGRERIGVEWLGEMDLDHFIIWAHHIWTDPKSGRLVREWKPWNGLQIYDPSGWKDTVEDPSVFNVPPAACKKGGAQFRINCDDEGNFRPKDTGDEARFAEYLRSVASSAPEAIVV